MKSNLRVPAVQAKNAVNLATLAGLLTLASLALAVSGGRCAQEPAAPPAETFAVGDAGPPEPPPIDDGKSSPTLPLPPPRGAVALADLQ